MGRPAEGGEDHLERASGAEPPPWHAEAWGQERQGCGKGEASFS